VTIASRDANLGLVGLRIEIEKRIRELAEGYGLVKSRALPVLAQGLGEKGVLQAETVAGLLELVMLGNQAAHGVRVAKEVAISAVEYGPRVLDILDAKLLELHRMK
jgi:hypothetical protein